MQSPRGERGGGGGAEEAREESSGQTEDGSDKPAEDCEATVPPAQQNQSGPEPDDPTPQLHPDHIGAEGYPPVSTNSENTGQEPVTLHLSNLNTPEEMEDQEPLPEEKKEEEEEYDNELIVLDPEHPLVRTHQAALNSHLRKRLERINLELKEKRAMEKADAINVQELGVEIFRVQEQLARQQTRLDDHHHSKAQAETKHRHAKDQLKKTKDQYSKMIVQDAKAKTNVSQLQAEMDNMMLQLTFMQGDSEDLRSNVKATMNARRKAGAEKNQAKDQKLKQDLYVERLTKDMERVTQQGAMYEAQLRAQAEETKATKEALFEAEMEMESLAMGRKPLLQQWSSSLMGMKRRDEAFSVMQEDVRIIEQQVILLDREIEGYKRSTTEEQERNETLTVQLNRSQMEVATSKKLINEKLTQKGYLEAQYSECLRILKQTESTLTQLSEETSFLHVEVNEQRRQLEKESAVRLNTEDKIMTHIQQKLTHNKAAKYSQQLTSRVATLKKQKISQLCQLENDVLAVGLEGFKVSQHLDSLTLTQGTLDEEIAKYNKLLTSNETKISSFVKLIRQKQTIIDNYKQKIYQIAASTGHEDLSPLQIKGEALKVQIKELSTNIKSDQQLWMRRQGTLVGLTQEIEANSKEMLKLQTDFTCMQQNKIRLESQMEAEHREQAELDKNRKMLKRDHLKLNTLLSKKGQLSQALEQENSLIETDFLHRQKEAERETIEMQMKHEKTQEEKERLLNNLMEAERQIVLWEKKTELLKETRSAVDTEGDIPMMKAEIHRMEMRLNQLMKQRQRLLRESEATVERRESIIQHKQAIAHSSRKRTTKSELYLVSRGLHHKIKDKHKHVVECEQVIRDLQQSQASLSNRLSWQKQQLIDLCGTSDILDAEYENLQDAKDRNLFHLFALQSRSKKLQAVCEGSYKALSTKESVSTALQSQMERVHAVSTVLHRMHEEFPEHQGALRRPSLALEARAQAASPQAASAQAAPAQAASPQSASAQAARAQAAPAQAASAQAAPAQAASPQSASAQAAAHRPQSRKTPESE